MAEECVSTHLLVPAEDSIKVTTDHYCDERGERKSFETTDSSPEIVSFP